MGWVQDWTMMESMSQTRIPNPVQDPMLFEPTKVRVLRAFCVGGQRQEPGAEVTVPFHVAKDLEAMGKVQLVA